MSATSCSLMIPVPCPADHPDRPRPCPRLPALHPAPQITDYSFFALQSSPNADTYDLSTMSTLAASMWFVCSVLNLAALILAWLYIFEVGGGGEREGSGKGSGPGSGGRGRVQMCPSPTILFPVAKALPLNSEMQCELNV